MPKANINIGDKYSKLEVIGKMLVPSFEHYLQTYYICKCDCGSLVKVTGSRLVNNQKKSCGCIRDNFSNARIKPFEGNATRNAVVRAYKSAAKKRLLKFSLTDIDLNDLFSGNCFYCGDAPWRTAHYKDTANSFTYNGIDRIDNSIGYTPENTVSCCSICNKAKLNNTAESFLTQVENIFNRIKTIKLERNLT